MAEELAALPSALIPMDWAEAAKEAKIANNPSIVLMIEVFFMLNGLKIKFLIIARIP